MRARAWVRAEPDGRGGARLTALRSQSPLVLRQTLDGVRLVAGAGGPLGGDDLALDLAVTAGAWLRVGSAAATVVQPGAVAGQWAHLAVTAGVGEGAGLRWCPEPTVLAGGAALRAAARISLAASSTLRWREVLVLGRVGEPGGSVESALHLDVAGAPVLRQVTCLGPAAPAGWDGPAVTAGHRVVGTLLVAGPGWGQVPAAYARRGAAAYAVLPLDAGAVLVSALGDTTTAVIAALAAALPPPPPPSAVHCRVGGPAQAGPTG